MSILIRQISNYNFKQSLNRILTIAWIGWRSILTERKKTWLISLIPETVYNCFKNGLKWHKKKVNFSKINLFVILFVTHTGWCLNRVRLIESILMREVFHFKLKFYWLNLASYINEFNDLNKQRKTVSKKKFPVNTYSFFTHMLIHAHPFFWERCVRLLLCLNTIVPTRYYLYTLVTYKLNTFTYNYNTLHVDLIINLQTIIHEKIIMIFFFSFFSDFKILNFKF